MIRNNRGFSIIEVLIAFGLIFMLIMQVSQFSATANQLKISLRAQSQIGMLTRGFKQNLMDPDACRNTFNALGPVSVGLTIPNLKNKNNVNVITFPFLLGTARAIRPSIIEITGTAPNLDLLIKFDYQIVISGAVTQTVSKLLEVRSVVSVANTVQSCNLPESDILAASFVSLRQNDFKEFNFSLGGDLTVGGVNGLKLDQSLPATGSPHLRLFNLDSASDRNLKENIKPLGNFKEKILNLDVIEFNYLNSKEKTIGLNAEQVKTMFPDAVREQDGKLFVNYFYFVPHIWEYTKDLKQRQARLKNWVKNESVQ